MTWDQTYTNIQHHCNTQQHIFLTQQYICLIRHIRFSFNKSRCTGLFLSRSQSTHSLDVLRWSTLKAKNDYFRKDRSIFFIWGWVLNLNLLYTFVVQKLFRAICLHTNLHKNKAISKVCLTNQSSWIVFLSKPAGLPRWLLAWYVRKMIKLAYQKATGFIAKQIKTRISEQCSAHMEEKNKQDYKQCVRNDQKGKVIQTSQRSVMAGKT